MNILKHPNPLLREKSREIERNEIFNPEFKNFIKDMMETMLKKDGVGLAGPQIGELKRIIIAAIDGTPQVYINPKITKKSLRKNTMEEGCLSIPDVYAKVKRPASIVVEYLDLAGEKRKIKANKMNARIFQHEIDHLDGVLFIDRIRK